MLRAWSATTTLLSSSLRSRTTVLGQLSGKLRCSEMARLTGQRISMKGAWTIRWPFLGRAKVYQLAMVGDLSVLVVTDDFVRKCPESPPLLAGVLYGVLQQNELRVAVDEPKRDIWSLYERVAKNSAEIARWLSYLSKDPALTIEEVALQPGPASSHSLFVALAVSAGDGCTLVVWGADECRAEATAAGVDRVDRARALTRIKPVSLLRAKRPPTRSKSVTVNIDTFISSSTDFVLVSKSSVQGTVGKYVAIDENVAKALADITTHVEKSGSKEAGEVWSSFAEEATKAQPSKAILKTLWDGLVRILSNAAKLTVAAQQIGSLFSYRESKPPYPHPIIEHSGPSTGAQADEYRPNTAQRPCVRSLRAPHHHFPRLFAIFGGRLSPSPPRSRACCRTGRSDSCTRHSTARPRSPAVGICTSWRSAPRGTRGARWSR